MPNERKTVMISSTARDLPEHRKEVMDACLRQGMFPVMMEHLPSSDAEAITASLKMVDEADIYVGVFAYRYGYIPKENNSKQISVTEMEYNRAIERGIPRLIFVMDKSHPITADDMDIENAVKLKTFKDSVQTNNIVNFFKSPADLRAHAINSLSQYRESDVTKFHYVSDIPQPPEAYIAHPYTLLQTHRLIGRRAELNLLTNWVTKKQDEIYWTRIMNIVAIGGMGKSALTWKWFNDIAPQEMKPLTGRMWWSFYESDATFENFVIRALAYVSKRSREDIEKNTKSGEREELLLQILDREPYLFVLDGLERILIAYARMDAARLSDDDIDQRTANFVTKVYGLPNSAAQSIVGQHILRKTTDPRAGIFLRKLTTMRSSRILVSTRLYPADIQSVNGEPIRGCSAIFLPGLNDDDALNLWRTFNVSGSRETLLPLFRKFENHPLLMQSLASEVANYRRAPGDFERWQKDHPNFDPFSLPMAQVKGHVLAFAMQGLYKKAHTVLETIAAFRMPANYDTLAAIFVGEGKIFPIEPGLDQTLKELEDRGLLGWDKRANRYDLHPIVRGTVWSQISNNARSNVFASLQVHFDSMPIIDEDDVNSIEDLTPAIELYNTLVGLERYEDAYEIFLKRIASPLTIRLSAPRKVIELAEIMFPNGWLGPSRIEEPDSQWTILLAAALAYQMNGQPSLALEIMQRGVSVSEDENLAMLPYTLTAAIDPLPVLESLYSAEVSARKAIVLMNQEKGDELDVWLWSNLGLILAARGKLEWSNLALQRALKMSKKYLSGFHSYSECAVEAYIGQQKVWLDSYKIVYLHANRAKELSESLENQTPRIYRLLGQSALFLGKIVEAEDKLSYALIKAREFNWITEEITVLATLAELQRRKRDFKAAREILDDLWELAERGPYPLFHADALNVLAQIERDEGNKDRAVEAATKAFRLAWCDGPPYAYHWGLEKAKQHLKELGAPEPEMPPFDESKFEPMPEVEINPKDEYWVDPDKEFDIDDLEK